MPNGKILDFLNSPDPLSDEAITYVLGYQEEDELVDYKGQFDIKSQKDWLSLAVDVMSFANSHGGYIVYGVDVKYNAIGLTEDAFKEFSDVSRLMSRINNSVSPAFSEIRTKAVDDKHVVILFVPENKRSIHIFTRDGAYRIQNSPDRVVFRMGSIYFRRSGQNQILNDYADLSILLDKHLSYFRERLMEKIATVVQAPTNSVILTGTPSSVGSNQTYHISEKNGIPIQGMCFTVAPRNFQEFIQTQVAISDWDELHIPRPQHLFELYENRESLVLNESQRARVIEFLLLRRFPCFYFLSKFKQAQAKDIIRATIKRGGRMEMTALSHIIRVASLYGETFYSEVTTKLGRKMEKVSPGLRSYNQHYLDSELHPIADRLKKDMDWKKLKSSDEQKQRSLDLLNNEIVRLKEDPWKETLVLRALTLDYALYFKGNLSF